MSSRILPVEGSRENFLELLMLADPEEAVVRAYLDQGWLFALYEDNELYGVMLLIEHDPQTLEIKNIAVSEKAQNKGYGKQLLQKAKSFGREQGYKTLMVGTGNSSLPVLFFYQKAGFRFRTVIRDFFIDNYQEPIFENGLQCTDMLILDQPLD
jgi:ribosomal protein S18 acetylase RimI-like enzyme